MGKVKCRLDSEKTFCLSPLDGVLKIHVSTKRFGPGAERTSSSKDVTEDTVAYTPDDIVNDLRSLNLDTRTRAAVAGHHLQVLAPSSTALLDAGIIAPLIEALDTNEWYNLQYEATTCLAEICEKHPQAHDVAITGGAIPKVIALFARGAKLGVVAVKTLGILGSGSLNRDNVLNQGALLGLLPYMQPDTPVELLQATVEAYHLICNNYHREPKTKLELLLPGLPHVLELLLLDDRNIAATAGNILVRLTVGPPEDVEAVQTLPGLMPRLTAAMDPSREPLSHSCAGALWTLSNMLSGTDLQRERCLNAARLDAIYAHLYNKDDDSIVLFAVRAASRVLSGTHGQIQRALDRDILKPLCYLLANAWGQWQVVEAITNLIRKGTAEQVSALGPADCLPPYLTHLVSSDRNVVILVLDGLTLLLQKTPEESEQEILCCKLEEMGAVDKLKAVQIRDDDEINKKISYLTSTYFDPMTERVEKIMKDIDKLVK